MGLSEELQLSIGSVTDIGGRTNNEDSILVQDIPATSSSAAGYVLAVADGMGGHEGGEIASSMAIDYLKDMFARDQPSDVALALKQAYRRANEAIYGDERSTGDRHMGTTLVSAVIRGKYATIANVGDSRAYLMRARQMTQITQDHSFVGEQIQKGLMTEEDARKSDKRNILTASIGTKQDLDKRLPSIYEIVLLPEDRLLLCSDGFFDVMRNEDYLELMSGDDANFAATSLVSRANERQTTDNVSAIVVSVGASSTTLQRQEIAAQLAEQKPGQFSQLLLPVAVLIIVIIAIAVGAWYFLM